MPVLVVIIAVMVKVESLWKGPGRYSNLAQHQRIHAREKPCECNRCEKVFNQVSNVFITIESILDSLSVVDMDRNLAEGLHFSNQKETL